MCKTWPLCLCRICFSNHTVESRCPPWVAVILLRLWVPLSPAGGWQRASEGLRVVRGLIPLFSRLAVVPKWLHSSQGLATLPVPGLASAPIF